MEILEHPAAIMEAAELEELIGTHQVTQQVEVVEVEQGLPLSNI